MLEIGPLGGCHGAVNQGHDLAGRRIMRGRHRSKLGRRWHLLAANRRCPDNLGEITRRARISSDAEYLPANGGSNGQARRSGRDWPAKRDPADQDGLVSRRRWRDIASADRFAELLVESVRELRTPVEGLLSKPQAVLFVLASWSCPKHVASKAWETGRYAWSAESAASSAGPATSACRKCGRNFLRARNIIVLTLTRDRPSTAAISCVGRSST